MSMPLRAGLSAALIFLFCVAAVAADKPFHRDDLADAAIRLEAQIKADAGPITRPTATLRRDADAALSRNDQRAAMQLLGLLVAAAPDDTADWLRLAKTILQVRPNDPRQRATLIERAATAAYIAYQRTSDPAEEADTLLLLGRSFADRSMWRPALDALRLSLDLREVADVRVQYEKMRDDHGFRLLDYTVDSDSASPRLCFQFSEELPGKRTDFSPFVSVAGQDRPALSVDDKQLCVEALRHGERYGVTLRAGLPSVKENLAKTADFSVYVRDRSPQVRFTGKAYVLPRIGQRGIPIVSVNTPAIAIKIYRIGDRNLLETVLGSEFQRNLDRFELERLGAQRGSPVWTGELKAESQLNAEVTTAFPVDQAVGDIAPGVYVMAAEPAPGKPDGYEELATQWFVVSDIGLTAFSGNDGIHVFVNSLASAAPKAQADVRLVARNNEVIATRRTDPSGHVVFPANLARGEGGLAPALLVASDPRGDYGFLNLKAPAFDLSDRGVMGRAAPAGLDAFVYTERGVYRTGETVHITALVRDSRGAAAPAIPLTLVVERPDGVEYRRAIVADQGIGGRALDLGIASTASSGTWRVRAFTDPKRPPVGETSFMVEDYVPDRMEFELASTAGAIRKGRPVAVTLDARFLYGAPASDLDIAGQVKVQATPSRPGFSGYQFGAEDDGSKNDLDIPLEDLPRTDANGRARFDVNIDALPDVARPMEARLTVSMSEAGGRAIERKLTLPIVPSTAMIGVKPLFSGASLGDNATATFDVIVAAPDATPLTSSGLRYELFRIDTRYQWYRQDGNWSFEPIKQTKRVVDGTVDVAADQPGRISVPVSWGRYRLEVSSSDGALPVTAISFDSGIYAVAGSDTPDLLETALDRPEYHPGDTMTLAVTARTAGKLLVNVVGDRVITTVNQDVQPGLNRVRLPVGRDWGNGGYVVATLMRPLEEAAQRMPGRAIGVQWFGIDRAARTLAVDMQLPALIRPTSSLRVPVKITGLAGDEARLVIAAVDVGILNLTGYKTPAPDEYFFGQRRLATEIRDLYGQLIDGMQGTRGVIRSGGDSAAAELQGSPPAQPPVALYSGIVPVTRDGTAEVAFDIPEFAGTLRVMAVAWTKDKVGSAAGEVTVRDPVVVTATLPRFILAGDRSTMQVDLDNVEGPAGAYLVTVAGDGPVRFDATASQPVELRANQRIHLTLPFSAQSAGVARIALRLAGPANFALERTYTLAAKPASQIATRRTVRTLAANEGLTLTGDLFTDLVPGTGRVALSIGPSTALDVATLLKELDRYPFGCSEQITSRALPLLYVNDLAQEANLELDGAANGRIRDAIERLMARQASNGSFGLWTAGSDDDAWLDSYVTDFLTRARERGFAVPDVGFRLAVDRLRNYVAEAPEPNKDGGGNLAYALYVLARNGAAPVGDLRYIADTRLGDLVTPIAKAQIAAALSLHGDRVRADRVFAAALEGLGPPPKFEPGRPDFGSTLRDAAALVLLMAESDASRATVAAAVRKLETTRDSVIYTSTQEEAWMVLAARAIGKQARLLLFINGEQRQTPIYRSIRNDELQAVPLRVNNTSGGPLQAVVSVSGAPLAPEPPAEKGFRIDRLFYTLDGKPANPAVARQNQRFAVVLRVTEPLPQFGRIMVTDNLPAGFEIDNPHLVSSGDVGALSWIENAAEPAYSEFRDDHFSAAFERNIKSPAVFTVAYVVRAVSPGTYALPQAAVEDMYRPDRYGRTGTGTVTVTAAQ